MCTKLGVAMIIAGDIGGTKTILAAYEEGSTTGAPLHEASFPSGNYSDIEAIVAEFVDDYRLDARIACFGVAGPVLEGHAKLPNLPWAVDAANLAGRFGFEDVVLLNDLEATAMAIPELTASDLSVINRGIEDDDGNKAVIAPGTGLGEAFLTRDGGKWRVHASEGGHADFAPTSALQIDLIRFLSDRIGHVSYERVCSGSGLPNIVDFITHEGLFGVSRELQAEFDSESDRTRVIVRRAIGAEADNLCRKAVEIFITILAAEAGNMALRHIARGGVYLAGGLPPRLKNVISDTEFMTSFRAKGRLSRLLEDTPVYIVENSRTVVIGAAAAGFDLAK